MKTPLSSERLRQHLTYSWWKYLLMAVLVVMGWSLTFSVTAYRSPEERKLEMYVYAYGDSERLDAWLAQRREKELPADQEEVSSVFVLPDETNGLMVLATRLMAGEGDFYVLPRTEYNNYSSQGLYMPLENLPGILEFCEAADINLERAWRRDADTAERHLYAIPAEKLSVLRDCIYTAGDYYIGIRGKCGNEANAIRLLAMLLRDSQPEAAAQAGLDALVNYIPPAEEAAKSAAD